MPASKPKGVIDDLFKPVSRRAVNDVRNIVRSAIAAEKRLALRQAAAKKTATNTEKRVAQQIEIGAKQMTRLTRKGAKPNKAMLEKRKPLAAQRVINAKNTQAKTTQTGRKADRAEAHFMNRLNVARSHFPDDKSFQKAWKEEKNSMRTGTPVPPTPKKATKPKAKPAPKKKK